MLLSLADGEPGGRRGHGQPLRKARASTPGPLDGGRWCSVLGTVVDRSGLEPHTNSVPRISLRILLWTSRPFASRGQDLVDLAGDIALQATDDLGF